MATDDEQRQPVELQGQTEIEQRQHESTGDFINGVKQKSARISMEQIRQCLRRRKPVTELVLTVAVIVVAIFAAIIAYKSDATFKAEEELLTKERLHLAREAFNKALDEADGFCSDCPMCALPFGIFAPLDKAVMREAELSEILTAAEYNRLAILGSSAWEFEKTNGFAAKALAKSITPIDQFMFNLVLGHLRFLNYKNDNDAANLRKGRDYFQSSIKALDDRHGTDAFRFYLGKAQALWATHERVVKNTDESHRHYILAKAHWEGLPGYENFARQLDVQLSDADSGHMLTIACLFHVASIPACVAPAGLTSPSAAPTPTPRPLGQLQPHQDPHLHPGHRWEMLPQPRRQHGQRQVAYPTKPSPITQRSSRSFQRKPPISTDELITTSRKLGVSTT